MDNKKEKTTLIVNGYKTQSDILVIDANSPTIEIEIKKTGAGTPV